MKSNCRRVALKPQTAHSRERSKYRNPFDIPSSIDIFSQQEKLDSEKKRNFQIQKKKTLAQRAISKTPDTERRALKKAYEERIREANAVQRSEIMPVSESNQRQQRASVMIDEQREIFLSNLLISRHQKEIDRLAYQRETKEDKLNNMEMDVKEAQNRSKTSSNQYENMRTRDRQKLDEIVRKRQSIEAMVKKKKLQINAIENEISREEETLQQYTSYENFLREINRATGKRPTTVKELIEIFEALEMDSLFIVQNYEHITGQAEESEMGVRGAVNKIQRQIQAADEEIARLKAEREELLSIGLENPVTKTTDDSLEKKLRDTYKLIARTFKKCVNQTDASQNSIVMLSQIESEIESMTQKLAAIDSAYVLAKLKTINETKRKEQREQNALKKKQLTDAKFKHMLERATKPIKRKTGRPVTARCLPSKTARRDSDRIEKEQHERERIQNLLFGPALYD